MSPRSTSSTATLNAIEKTVQDLELDNMEIDKKEWQSSIDAGSLYKSRFDNLTIGQALWTFRKALFYCFCIFTGRMLEYFAMVVTGAILVNPGFIKQFGDPIGMLGSTILDPNWISAWGAVGSAGGVIAMLSITWFADRFGRKLSLLLAWLFTACSMICLTTANSKGVWLVGQIFMGAGIGIIGVIVAPYGMEICPTRVRGLVLSAAIFWGAIATLLASVMMNELTKRHPLNWHLPIYATWGPVGFMLLCFLVVPESPWFYARHGDKDNAMKALRKLYGGVPGYDFEEEYSIIVRTVEHERSQIQANKASGWTDLWKGTNGKRTISATIISASVQLGGFPLLYSFAPLTYAYAGFSNPFQVIVITSTVQCVVVLFMMSVFDRYGRRPFVTTSYSFQAISMLLWGCMNYVDPKKGQNRFAGLYFSACLWAATATIAGNSQTLYVAELPAAYLRIKTGVFCYVLHAVIGIVFTFAVPRMLTTIGLKSGFVFFATATPIAIFLWFFLPETKWRSAAEIDELYERRIPAWRWNKTRTKVEDQLDEVTRKGEAINTIARDPHEMAIRSGMPH
ncbi:hypothetical protein A1Q2_05686 [Trichosporon asahii var. asahii CBS 8904]|uniref:Major facilitator superfamily (MFS) profile domain-containing protein n=2 Tax=Trichosporon asahii var. asahii TaxID=189963 RepID=K1VTK0_TRIAC|nr:hypothetical protein A1Q1_03066 [Trichosporon asahii var. asahii CBS 2479]EJT52612.1 hypothetical protein A1Q1_03066 [Trichosporon asahii var. asahii CBS 2479]EKD00028.1 hypothetical protein A1Q2_05686 [Trichosporon asahii var. asahii CBS 8904]